ncbi:MAG: hypothetical protein V1857_06475 [archaeon]
MREKSIRSESEVVMFPLLRAYLQVRPSPGEGFGMNAKIRGEADRIITQHLEITHATEGPVVQRMIEGYRKRLLKT